jgi:hypothetical protein
MVNLGDATFVNRAEAAGLAPFPGGGYASKEIKGRAVARSLRAAATLDADRDGRVDLLVQSFNERTLYYRNVGPTGSWVGLRLVGTRSHRDAVGAVVRVTAGGRTFTRLVQGAGGYLSQASRALHVGLAGATRIEACEIVWPGGGRQRVEGLRLGEFTTVEETP